MKGEKKMLNKKQKKTSLFLHVIFKKKKKYKK